MNRILFLLGLMLSGLLVSCSPDAPRYTIGVSQCSDDTWRHKMNERYSGKLCSTEESK